MQVCVKVELTDSSTFCFSEIHFSKSITTQLVPSNSQLGSFPSPEREPPHLCSHFLETQNWRVNSNVFCSHFVCIRRPGSCFPGILLGVGSVFSIFLFTLSLLCCVVLVVLAICWWWVEDGGSTVSISSYWCLWFQTFVSSGGQPQLLALTLTFDYWTIFKTTEGNGDYNSTEAQSISESCRRKKRHKEIPFPRGSMVEKT